MAVDKAKRVGKKGQKKKVVDPFSKKDWYDVKAPSYFEKRNVGKTLVTRTQGNKMAADGLKGRVFEMSLADMQGNEELAYRKVRLIVEDVSGKNVLLNFHGMDFSSDKLKGMVRKWQSLIEAMVEVKTTDNYVLRIFTIAFTKKHKTQIKKTCYAQSSQIRQIRQKIFEIVQNAANGCDLKEFVKKLIAESIGKEIEKSCQSIYPLQNVYVRKVKILRKPKLDLSKLMELHGDVSSSSEGKVNREGKEFSEPAVLETV